MALITSRQPIAVSAALQRFTDEVPHERGSILEFVRSAAASLTPGSRLLDVGAGDSPYRELFGHVRYESNDWEHSVHPGARRVDHVGPANAIPVGDGEFDAVLCTQVLEHVPDPRAVIAELYRVLRPGGRLFMTLPLVWELHEQPFDFFRYTPHGLATMLSSVGFDSLDIRPRNDSFATLAQLMQNFGSMVGRYPDGRDGERSQALARIAAMGAEVERYIGLDARWVFPLGYSVVASRPAGGAESESGPGGFPDYEGGSFAPEPDRLEARSKVGLARARTFVTLCFASDVLIEPHLLSAYAGRFSAADDATLAIYAPRVDLNLASAALMGTVQRLGLTGSDSPDMIGLPFTTVGDEAALALSADAVLSMRPPSGAFAGLPWMHPGTIDGIHRAMLGSTDRRGPSQD